MAKVALPMGLFVGALVVTTVVTPTIFSSSSINLFSQTETNSVQAQTPSFQNGSTSQSTLEEILRDISDEVEVSQNQILFTFEDQAIQLITDGDADRMRLIIPLAKIDELTGEDMAKMMIANFHTALDGRYAIGGDIVFAAFVHPLSTLTERDFRSAVLQVTRLAQTYGSTYSSGSSLFGAPVRSTPSELDLPSI